VGIRYIFPRFGMLHQENLATLLNKTKSALLVNKINFLLSTVTLLCYCVCKKVVEADIIGRFFALTVSLMQKSKIM
jgi:hypothetical protein